MFFASEYRVPRKHSNWFNLVMFYNCIIVVQLLSHVQPHGLQHTRLPCPSPSPGVFSNSCLLRQWCYLTISCSVVPFSSCFQSFLTSGSISMGWLFTGGQSIVASAFAPVLPINTWSSHSFVFGQKNWWCAAYCLLDGALDVIWDGTGADC